MKKKWSLTNNCDNWEVKEWQIGCKLAIDIAGCCGWRCIRGDGQPVASQLGGVANIDAPRDARTVSVSLTFNAEFNIPTNWFAMIIKSNIKFL